MSDEGGTARTQSRTQYWMPAVIASASTILGVLDTSMMNVAVPSIVQVLGLPGQSLIEGLVRSVLR